MFGKYVTQLVSRVKLKVVGQGQHQAQGKTKIFDTMRHIIAAQNADFKKMHSRHRTVLR